MYLNFLKRRIIFEAKRKLASVSLFSELRADTNTLVVTYRHELPSTQIYPLYFYAKELKAKHDIRFQEIDISKIPAQDQSKKNGNIRRIYFQHAFMMDGKALVACLETLVVAFPQAKIAFMDWFAPLHIQYANLVDPFIDLYIKKQTFIDFEDYNKPTIGDTNLSDYYARRFDLPEPTMQFASPPGFVNKIRLWPNFYLSPQMVDLFSGPFPQQSARTIDLHARIAVKGVPWYQVMRQEAKDSVDRLNGIEIASEGRVKRYKFFAELKNSKIVFSPFGYGEVCWRDYEAFATGALLIKPTMDHMVTDIDIFRPGETYVSTRWDLEDFEEKLNYYLSNPTERAEIAERSFNEIKRRISGSEIIELIGAIN